MVDRIERLMIFLWFLLMGFLLGSSLLGLLPPDQTEEDPEEDPRDWVWDA